VSVAGVDQKNPTTGVLSSIHRTLGKTSKVSDDDGTVMQEKGSGQFSDHSLAKAFLDSKEFIEKKRCSICSSNPAPFGLCCNHSEEESCGDACDENPLAIVSVPTNDSASKPGWPLLHRTIISDRKYSERSLFRQISVVQWAMQLPSRNLSYAAHLDQKTNYCGPNKDQFLALDSKSGALVPVDTEIGTATLPEHNSRSIPKELEGLHEKYSSSCRLFEYQELVLATSNFLPGDYFILYLFESWDQFVKKRGFIFNMVCCVISENLIGKGGSSQVYRGCLPDGKELAVKILKPSDDVLKEFVLEIEIITTLHHKNIISLLGFCFEDGNLLLVYDFLSRGSLEENIHGTLLYFAAVNYFAHIWPC